jgi:hypothetical protein
MAQGAPGDAWRFRDQSRDRPSQRRLSPFERRNTHARSLSGLLTNRNLVLQYNRNDSDAKKEIRLLMMGGIANERLHDDGAGVLGTG